MCRTSSKGNFGGMKLLTPQHLRQKQHVLKLTYNLKPTLYHNHAFGDIKCTMVVHSVLKVEHHILYPLVVVCAHSLSSSSNAMVK